MKKTYEKPAIKMMIFESESIITASNVGFGLTNGGKDGKADSESFDSLFGN